MRSIFLLLTKSVTQVETAAASRINPATISGERGGIKKIIPKKSAPQREVRIGGRGMGSRRLFFIDYETVESFR